MRILMLNHNVAWKGTFLRCYHLGRHMAQAGHTVTVVTTSPTQMRGITCREAAGVEIVETPSVLRGGPRSGFDHGPCGIAAGICGGGGMTWFTRSTAARRSSTRRCRACARTRRRCLSWTGPIGGAEGEASGSAPRGAVRAYLLARSRLFMRRRSVYGRMRRQ